MISPLVCQSIIATGVPWYRFYYGSLVLSGLNILFLAVTFRPTPAEAFKDRQRALNDARRRKSQYLRSGRSSPVNETDSGKISTAQLNLEIKPRSCKSERLDNDPHELLTTFVSSLTFGSDHALPMGPFLLCIAILWKVLGPPFDTVISC